MSLYKKSKQHLHHVNESYFSHLCCALKFSGQLFVAAIAGFIHAVFPCFMTHTASDMVRKIHADMVPRADNCKQQAQKEE